MIEVHHRGNPHPQFPIEGISSTNSTNQFLNDSGGGDKVSILEYYMTKYGIQIGYVNT